MRLNLIVIVFSTFEVDPCLQRNDSFHSNIVDLATSYHMECITKLLFCTQRRISINHYPIIYIYTIFTHKETSISKTHIFELQPSFMPNPRPPPPAIIDLQYCVPHPVDLIITKERTIAENFTVTDINGNIVFTVESSLVTIVTPRQHRFLLDAFGKPLLHLRRALMTANDSWKAFRGESTEPNDLIFTRKRSSLFQLRTKLNVFLANNTTEVCDFKVKASFSGRSWVVYFGESDNVVAQINKKRGTIFSREKFMVTVCPNIDYAFIVALIMTLRRRTAAGEAH